MYSVAITGALSAEKDAPSGEHISFIQKMHVECALRGLEVSGCAVPTLRDGNANTAPVCVRSASTMSDMSILMVNFREVCRFWSESHIHLLNQARYQHVAKAYKRTGRMHWHKYMQAIRAAKKNHTDCVSYNLLVECWTMIGDSLYIDIKTRNTRDRRPHVDRSFR